MTMKQTHPAPMVKDGDAPVILISMVLVLVGAVTLVIGYFNAERPGFIYATLATSLLAAVFLILGVLRERPGAKRQAALVTAGAQPWGGSGGGVGTLERDDAEFGGLETSYDDPVTPSRQDEDGNEDTGGGDEPDGWWSPEPGDEDAEPRQTELLDPPESTWQDNGHNDIEALVYEDEDEDEDEEQLPAWEDRESDREAPEPDFALESEPEPLLQRTPSITAPSSAERETERFLEALRPVRGVGPSKQSDLLAHFKTLRRLRNASVDRIAEVPGISTTLAQRIHNELHRS
ncbi:MAG: helix-hairpin-helix domain-containing protein [Egibacteraceae bacterium]